MASPPRLSTEITSAIEALTKAGEAWEQWCCPEELEEHARGVAAARSQLEAAIGRSMQTCKTCRHWDQSHYATHADMPEGWHMCAKLDRGYGYGKVASEALAAMDWSPIDEGASFYSAPDFGCVMHEPAAEAAREDDGA